ncbi:hypothetical protein [Kurthia massiliensis]|uniref:hypothetical protein n=1 Tax=Kurthia massiliensis TaxID=1033739 RepID=UPI000289F85B|nr:hypothetical protein [Kurthia massiliensis]
MKKLLIAASLALGISATSSFSSSVALTAHAEEAANLSPRFVKALKNGTIPRAKGKVGMTYKTFTKKGPIIKDKYGNSLREFSVKNSLTDEDGYSFNKKITPNAKITSISRAFNYVISYDSIEKNFGKPYKGVCSGSSYRQETNIHKAGKYYFSYYVAGAGSAKANSWDHDTTYITVGTKKELMKDIYMGCSYKKLYR